MPVQEIENTFDVMGTSASLFEFCAATRATFAMTLPAPNVSVGCRRIVSPTVPEAITIFMNKLLLLVGPDVISRSIQLNPPPETVVLTTVRESPFAQLAGTVAVKVTTFVPVL